MHLNTSFEAEMHPWPRDDFGDSTDRVQLFYLLLVVPGGKIFSDMKVFQPGRIVGVLQGKWRAGKKKSKERVVSKPLDF